MLQEHQYKLKVNVRNRGMATNNDYLSDMAGQTRNSGKSNNQLLETIASNGSTAGLTNEERDRLDSIANKADLIGGKVPESQLPSYIDNVQEYLSLEGFPETGESNIINLNTADNTVFRWGGNSYVQISSGVVIGETETSAHRGDHGVTAYNHTLNVNNPHQVTKGQIGLGNVNNTSDAEKPVSSPQAAAIFMKENTITPATISEYYRGDKTWAVLNKSAVGLSNVDNTSDINKPVSTPTIDALQNKVDKEVGKGLTEANYTSAEKLKLSNLDQTAIESAIAKKVDKDGSKILSDNNYTTEEKSKLASLEDFDASVLQDSIDLKVDKLDGFGLSQTSYTQAEKNKLANIAERYFGRFTSQASLQAITGISGGYAYVSLPSVPTEIFAWNTETNQWDNTALASGEETAESIKTKYETNPDTNAFTDMEKVKLAAILIDATKNDSDANLKNRANHTGTQAQTTITGLTQRLTDIDNLIEAIVRIDDGQTLILESHRNNRDNPHQVTKSQVGLGNVDNTSDLDKPVPTAVTTALGNKADTVHNHTIDNITNLQTSLDAKMAIPSSTFAVPIRGSTLGGGFLPYTVDPTPSTFPVRSTAGTFHVTTPTQSTHVANKAYIDARSALPTVTTVNGWRRSEYIDRFEYVVKIPFSYSLTANQYLNTNTTTGLPDSLTFDSVDEHYISITQMNVAVHGNVNIVSNVIRIAMHNTYNGTSTATGSVTIKLVNYK